MIKVLLMGGIGNQLFQINRALSLQLSGAKVEIIYMGIFKNLIHFFIRHVSHDSWIDLNSFTKKLDLKTRPINLVDLIMLTYFYFLKKINLYQHFDSTLKKQIFSKKVYDLGYFQEKKHFINKSLNIITESLIDYLELRSQIIPNKKVVGFHIRGGDFMKEINNKNIEKRPNFNLLKSFFEKYTEENINFFIITNDKNLIKKNQFNLDQNAIFSSKELDDFKKLIQCNLMYVSQSTFCFWAYIISKKLHNCEVINFDNWIYRDLIISDQF